MYRHRCKVVFCGKTCICNIRGFCVSNLTSVPVGCKLVARIKESITKTLKVNQWLLGCELAVKENC